MLRQEKAIAFPNTFRRTHFTEELVVAHQNTSQEVLQQHPISAKLAGRIMTRRVMGKAAFLTLQDGTGRLQLYIKSEEVGEALYDTFKKWDLGDIVGAEGVLFKTHTGELTLRVASIRLLVKALLPLPDKYHGLEDPELRYRKRYLDLLTNESKRTLFKRRAQIVDEIRAFLKKRNFLEVETPMMQPIPGGATAKPFVTHHNALNMPLYLRVAPELYLKRLIVAGFERVFEVNRSFRNEGTSSMHNPEFTMLEFYQAYADYQDLMAMTEELFRMLATQVLGASQISYQGHSIVLGQPFARMRLSEAIVAYTPGLTEDHLKGEENIFGAARSLGVSYDPSASWAEALVNIFEQTVEAKLIQPTFITHYPTVVSPLSRPNDEDGNWVDRFELFVGGLEVANGFSELNDPELQAKRFAKQAEAKAQGNEEAMFYDEDYITALEYGMPPTAGEGIGIDRLIMLLTDSASIREVLLFPLLKPSL
ncbi:MAG: lysine--tRNA ligase [Gammaproteobacteria bacterium]|nr:lysine--tRNA ligase [Gammaproteobacteria bacterium]